MPMKIKDVLCRAADILKKSGIDNSENEARWIFESCFENGRNLIYFNRDEEINPDLYFEKIEQRAEGRPLQYVIGSWDFYGGEFKVGEGVLIPRPETEMLVEFACEYLKNKKYATVVDLCSGSGCIGISVAKALPDNKIILVEKSEEAMKYLRENAEKSECRNITVIKGDAFCSPLENGIENFDLLLSNPPYIPSAEIRGLQGEVQREPVMALDGGADGLDFYRAIAEKWLDRCNGAVCVECGEEQAEKIIELFSPYCKEAYSKTDFRLVQRTVCGIIK